MCLLSLLSLVSYVSVKSLLRPVVISLSASGIIHGLYECPAPSCHRCGRALAEGSPDMLRSAECAPTSVWPSAPSTTARLSRRAVQTSHVQRPTCSAALGHAAEASVLGGVLGNTSWAEAASCVREVELKGSLVAGLGGAPWWQASPARQLCLVGPCWPVLARVGPCWPVLARVGPCWPV